MSADNFRPQAMLQAVLPKEEVEGEEPWLWAWWHLTQHGNPQHTVTLHILLIFGIIKFILPSAYSPYLKMHAYFAC
jgi:hypothetical protein